ncbi:MAG TPA: hypothetical protein VGN54_02330 [Mycobacteriales bacterium]|jgi:hydroxyacyl-ACP dehydratase HTD2-like protein with hotdog domain|nr:hypothetical protein [Mycobacteriales bacterium]
MEPANFVRVNPFPVVTRTYRPQDLFLFSAATWNAHRIHYDQDYVVATEGHEGLLVHGPLQAVQMFQVLINQLAEGARLQSVRYRHLSALFVGQEVAMSGRLAAMDEADGTATFDLWIERVQDRQRTTTGNATVRLAATD